jgi:hypothetical protein
MPKAKPSNNPGRDNPAAEQEGTLRGAIPVSAIAVSGLYRLSTDKKLPFVQRREMLQPASISGHEAESEEYPDPDLNEDIADTLLGGPRMQEELRLDVDGDFPQMTASGSIQRWLAGRIHWIAKLRSSGRFSWSGHIWYKDGAAQLFPYTNVVITASRSLQSHQRRITAVFSGGGAPPRVRAFRYHSPYFRAVNFEYDHEAEYFQNQGITPVTAIDTDAHPNRPASLPIETLSIDTVYRRAGFRTTRSPADRVPVAGAGANARWSDTEMHDAMQAYWSLFANRPQWSLWTFFAGQHEMGSSLGGIMFDDIGPNHRQGTALFYNSFISQAPAGDADPGAWIDRMRFWTAVHEMGHAFNLAHSWQKSLVFNGDGPWIPLADEPEARSFMNYPYNVAGGQTAFFADFEFRFSDSELLFLRHAPERFVQMGNADWFDHHGFEQTDRSAEPTLRLQLRANRDQPRFEFLEPVMLELKLTNASEQPQLVPEDLLKNADRITVIVKRQGQPARSFQPYAQYCRKVGQTVLGSGKSMYESLFVAAGQGGWLLAEPGTYVVQACLHLPQEDVVSNACTIRIAPPLEKLDERLAQDYFSDEVGRVLAFDGSGYFGAANNALREIVAQLGDRRATPHAQVALNMSGLRNLKQLDLNDKAELRIVTIGARGKEARTELDDCLGKRAKEAAETLGHIDYNEYVNRYYDALMAEGDKEAVRGSLSTFVSAQQTLRQRGVVKEVVDALGQRIQEVEKKAKAA